MIAGDFARNRTVTRVAAHAYRLPFMVDGRVVGDRANGRYDGTGLDRRRAAVTESLLAQGR